MRIRPQPWLQALKKLGLRSNHHIFQLLLAVQYNMSKVCILVVNNTLDLKKGIGGGETTVFVGFAKFG